MLTPDLDNKLRTFAQLMQNSQEFSDIDDYFHDKLASSDEFMAAGVERKNSRLLGIIRIILKSVTSNSQVGQSILSVIEEHGFWHGSVLPRAGGMALVFYFEGVNRGLVTYAKALTDTTTQFMRFSIPEALTGDEDPDQATLASMSRRPPGGRAIS